MKSTQCGGWLKETPACIPHAAVQQPPARAAKQHLRQRVMGKMFMSDPCNSLICFGLMHNQTDIFFI
ncbi:hypothetical protein SAMN02746065_12529 [Desulfocicer vacuolatum DSM 3385]|uniref:Uncharacterized protein n=1 Tax=Desulfocicer vacuolatum DSM 3385 TaxID=1121400 RepID=A0A1W2E737_9BACT|nr:hypothetical protein SAMN02746065_12529 [Desulfocicer vacuolatum DSM 3385]